MTETTDRQRHLAMLAARALFALTADALERLELAAYHIKIHPANTGGPSEVEVYLSADDTSDVRRLASALGIVGTVEERTDDTVTDYRGARYRVDYFHITTDRREDESVTWRLWASWRSPLLEDEVQA